MKSLRLIISCEHAVNSIPADFDSLFHHHQHLLNSHAGIDYGALEIATYLNEQLPTAFYARACVSRLLIDCNRSLHHRQCFSNLSSSLNNHEKSRLIDTYYQPFRQGVIQAINRQIQQHYRVLHLSIHSFTPILNDKPRLTDIGLLYDPSRESERLFVKSWQHALQQFDSQLRVRLNYPYRGTSDGFTSALRKLYSSHDYLGIEVETNQLLSSEIVSRQQICQTFATTLMSFF